MQFENLNAAGQFFQTLFGKYGRILRNALKYKIAKNLINLSKFSINC